MITRPLSLPTSLQKYFWGDNLSELDFARNQKYITEVLLERGDRPALRWLLTQVDKKTLANSLPELHLSPKSANFWKVYLS